jgi:hypothetical protein
MSGNSRAPEEVKNLLCSIDAGQPTNGGWMGPLPGELGRPMPAALRQFGAIRRCGFFLSRSVRLVGFRPFSHSGSEMDLKTLSRNAGMAVNRLLFDPEPVSKPDHLDFRLSLWAVRTQSSLFPQAFSLTMHRCVGRFGKQANQNVDPSQLRRRIRWGSRRTIRRMPPPKADSSAADAAHTFQGHVTIVSSDHPV